MLQIEPSLDKVRFDTAENKLFGLWSWTFDNAGYFYELVMNFKKAQKKENKKKKN